MKRNLLIITLLGLFACNNPTDKKAVNSEDNHIPTNNLINLDKEHNPNRDLVTGTISEEIKFAMFRQAVNNFSTAPNFVVITAKNLDTGEEKEVCTEASLFWGLKLDQSGQINKYADRYFEFTNKNDSNFLNFSFNSYTIPELEEYAKTIDVKNIVQQVKEGTLQSKTFGFDDDETFDWKKVDKEQKMFAHLMFNNGVMMTRGCLAGNMSSLDYFEQLKTCE